MKTYKYIILVGLLTLLSCDDFLDNQPLSEVTTSGDIDVTTTSKYKSADDARTELNGAYKYFQENIFSLELFVLNDVQSDNCYLGNDEVPGMQVDNMKVTSMNTKLALYWGEYYGIAGIGTSVIENTRLMDNSLISDTDRKSLIAEGRFLRALAYLDIVRLWGDAPLTLKLIPTINKDNIDEVYPLYYPARSTSAEIYEAIINDLNAAVPDLPSSKKGVFNGSKGAAYGLLAKAYASRGVKAERDYNKVVEYCDKVIAEGYSLLPSYDDLWNPNNKGTSESIFEVAYTAEQPNWACWVLLKEEDGTVTWRRYCTPTHELLSKYEANDTRKASSFIWKEAPYDAYYSSSSYPFAYKIREKYSNIILMRLADIILLKAEALVELNRSAEAIDLVNQIRNRAGLTDLNKNMSQNEARLAVEKERQLELVLEGHRWFDLVRNERMVDVMTQHKGPDGKPFLNDVQSFRSLLPIPQTERDINTSLTQNEGY